MTIEITDNDLHVIIAALRAFRPLSRTLNGHVNALLEKFLTLAK